MMCKFTHTTASAVKIGPQKQSKTYWFYCVCHPINAKINITVEWIIITNRQNTFATQKYVYKVHSFKMTSKNVSYCPAQKGERKYLTEEMKNSQNESILKKFISQHVGSFKNKQRQNPTTSSIWFRSADSDEVSHFCIAFYSCFVYWQMTLETFRTFVCSKYNVCDG